LFEQVGKENSEVLATLKVLWSVIEDMTKEISLEDAKIRYLNRFVFLSLIFCARAGGSRFREERSKVTSNISI